jgi:hypothetical protein
MGVHAAIHSGASIIFWFDGLAVVEAAMAALHGRRCDYLTSGSHPVPSTASHLGHVGDKHVVEQRGQHCL